MEPIPFPDPFAIQGDPGLYVPRRATEQALDELERAVSSPAAAVCFSGPPGIGKTLLLHVLGAELAPRLRAAYLPYSALPPGELWLWTARELGLDPGPEPARAVRRYVAGLAVEGRGLLLEIDDASSLPADTLEDALALARLEPGLRLLLAHSEDERLAAPLPDDVARVLLDRPMSRVETQDYVKGRLSGAGATRGVLDRFDTVTVARLHREAEGIPLRVHGLAVAILRRGDAPVPDSIAERSAPRVAVPLVAPSATDALERERAGSEPRVTEPATRAVAPATRAVAPATRAVAPATPAPSLASPPEAALAPPRPRAPAPALASPRTRAPCVGDDRPRPRPRRGTRRRPLGCRADRARGLAPPSGTRGTAGASGRRRS